MKIIDLNKLHQALSLLNERLILQNAPKVRLVVCGGSALIAMGLVPRTTQDMVDPEPMPEYLISAAGATAQTLSLPKDWLNCGPADLFRMGLPKGTFERLTKVEIGVKLDIYYVSRLDQIFFKLYAAVDRGGYHIDDLLKLNPTSEELFQAAQWTMTHDVSDGFRCMLRQLLTELDHEDVSRRI